MLRATVGDMRLRWSLLLVLGLGSAHPALAQVEPAPEASAIQPQQPKPAQLRRRVGQYQPEELTDEEAEHERTTRRSRLVTYAQDEAPPETPFPWRLVSLGALLFAVIAPFAYSAWKSSSEELTALQKAFGRRSRITRRPAPPPSAPDVRREKHDEKNRAP